MNEFDERLPQLAVPVVLLLALGFVATPVGGFFALFVDMPFHELGHAFASWLGARVALPLPFFTFWQEEQSWMVGLLVLALWGFVGFTSWQQERYAGLALASILTLATLTLWWFVPAPTSAMWQILGGPLGPLVLPAIPLALFPFRLHEELRWDFWRFLVLFPATLAFANAALLYARAVDDPSLLPWGSALGDSSDGDLNRLVANYGWTGDELARFGRSVSRWLLLVILGCSAGAWLRGWLERQAELD
ncbi:MAG TPA: hypothetical protein VLC09_02395 [Polyangiaceae bacterium]|nr:hypothetical protein [Polyangiaceae bacterium]